MLKLILSALVTVCGLSLKKRQFNKLLINTESYFKTAVFAILNYFADILSDIIVLFRIIAWFRPRKRVLLLRALLTFLVSLSYLFLGPNTSVNATYPERVIQPQTETAVISITDSVTTEAVPVFKAPTRGYISSYYSSYHRGIDIPNPTGTLVKPFTDGEVVFAGWASGGFGNMVAIKHNLGYVSRYAHLSTIDVSIGQKVTSDTIIGRVGSTGNSTGAHLHFEVYLNDVPVNPLNYISLSN